MRFPRLLLALTPTLALGLASPAMAADVNVPGFLFAPSEVEIPVGETVVWSFNDPDGVLHSTRAERGQAESWSSGLKAPGETFQRTFNEPGKFQFFCEPHPYMQGSVTVGEDVVKDTVDAFKRTRRGNNVKVTFELNEAATATYRITKGPSRRTVKEGREDEGRHSFRLKNLKAGDYRGKLTLVDDFDKKTVVRNRFAVP